MDNVLQWTVHCHVCDFFEGKVDHEGWHKSQCIPVPKQGDLRNPNKWCGIMLMDMCSKVFLSVMTAQAFALLDKHGMRFQFGGTPEIGCRDGLFTLKALLNARRNHDLASYVGFVDLVKVYDTANHVLLIDILCKYGAPPKFTTAIKTIYRNNTCVLKIESEIAEIPQTVGVYQGDNMAPVLFLFLMTAFAKTLELKWREQDIPILSVMMAAHEHIAEGKICSHTLVMFRSKKLTAYEILQCLYVDDGTFPFGTREDLQQVMELIYHHFAGFGLEMHIGCGALESKTECLFFPPPQFFQRLERTNAADSTIQHAFQRTRHAHFACAATQENPQDQLPTASSIALLKPPTSFPTGCHVIVSSSHPKHAKKTSLVTRHTAKFVTFAPNDCPQCRIRILPRLLTIASPLKIAPPAFCRGKATQNRIALLDTDENQARAQEQKERKNAAYDKLPETANFPVADGHVSFTRTFRYLGSLINYSLRDDDDITA
jgi:hypothetical protein